MCDCYTATCEFCGNRVETHIADYSAKRIDVKVVCHECVHAGKSVPIDKDGKIWVGYPDRITREEQVWEEFTNDTIDIGEVGALVVFYCCDRSGYGIHLN